MEYRKRLPFDENAPKRSGNAARWGTAALTAIALLVLATPAAGSIEKSFSPASASFSLRAGNGYRILVDRFRGQVSLSALHDGRSFFAVTSYTVPVKFSPQRIVARFGKFGRVSVRLKTERMRKGKLEEQCTGKPETIRYGVFVGTIRFRGEGGYTSVDARRATGQSSSGTKVRCVFPNLRPGSGTAARASRQNPPSLVAFQGRQRVFVVEASRGNRHPLSFSAVSQEQRGRMEIFRDVFAGAPLSSFAFASDLSSATVHPPAPFRGEAGFQRTPTGPTWAGTLSVDFPGREDVRLSGPRFEANLTREDSGHSSIFFSGR